MSRLQANGHTSECNADMERERAVIAAYEARWPDYCRTCHGAGCIYEYNYPYEPDWTDSCFCLDEGRCPRCGVRALDERGTVCYSCMWVFSDQSVLAPYGRSECDCWIPTYEEERLIEEYAARSWEAQEYDDGCEALIFER